MKVLRKTIRAEAILGDGGTEQKGKRTHGHEQQCGDCRGEGSIRELNGNKKYNKNH